MAFSEQVQACLLSDPLDDSDDFISPIRLQSSRTAPRNLNFNTTPSKANSQRPSMEPSPQNRLPLEDLILMTESASKTWTISPGRKRADSEAVSPWRIRVTVQAEPSEGLEEMDTGYLTEPVPQLDSEVDEDIWLDENSFRGRRITAGTTVRKIPLRGLSSSPPRQQMRRKSGTPKKTPKSKTTPKKTPKKSLTPAKSPSASKSSPAKARSLDRAPSRASPLTPSRARRELTPAPKGDIHSILSLAASDSSVSPHLELSRNITTRRGRSRSNSQAKEPGIRAVDVAPPTKTLPDTTNAMQSYEFLEDSTTPEGSPTSAMKSWLAQEEDSYLPTFEAESENEQGSHSQPNSSYYRPPPAFAKSIYQDDSIMESEGFSMVSVSSIPSMRDAVSSPSTKDLSESEKRIGNATMDGDLTHQLSTYSDQARTDEFISQRGGPSSFVFPARLENCNQLSNDSVQIEDTTYESSDASLSVADIFAVSRVASGKTPLATSSTNVPGVKKPGHKRQSSKGLETATNLHHLAQAGMALQEAVRSPEKSTGAAGKSFHLKDIQEDDVFSSSSSKAHNSPSISRMILRSSASLLQSDRSVTAADQVQLPTPRTSVEPETECQSPNNVSMQSADEMSWKATTPPIKESPAVSESSTQLQEPFQRPRARNQKSQPITPARKAMLNAASQHLRSAPRPSPQIRITDSDLDLTESAKSLEHTEEDEASSGSPFAPQFTSSIILPDVGALSDPWKTGPRFDWSVRQEQTRPATQKITQNSAAIIGSSLEKSPVLADEIQDLTKGLKDLDTKPSFKIDSGTPRVADQLAPPISAPKPKIKPLRLWGRPQFKDLNCVYLESLMDPPLAPKKLNLPRDLDTIDLSEQVFEAYGREFVITRNDLLVCLDFLARLMRAEKYKYTIADKDVDGRKWDLQFLAEKLVAIKIGEWLSTQPELREDLVALEIRGKEKLDAARRKAKEYVKSELSGAGRLGGKPPAIGASKLREPLRLDGPDAVDGMPVTTAQGSLEQLPSDGRRWRMW